MTNLNTWAGLNAKNANNVITPTIPTVGPVKSFLNSSAPGIGSTTPNLNFFSNLKDHLASYGSNVMGDINNDVSGITNNLSAQNNPSLSNGPVDPATGLPQNNNAAQALTHGYNSVADALDAVTSPLTELFKGTIGKANTALQQGVGNLSDTLMNAPQGTSNARNAQAQTNVNSQIQAYAQAHPEVAQNLDSLNKIIQGSLAVTGANEVGEGIEGAVNRSADAAAQTPAIGGETTQSSNLQDTLNSRIQDATPTYNKNMIGKNVMTPDTTDTEGNITKGQITPRIASEGEGLTGQRPVTTSASEQASGTELNNIKDYPDKGTALEKGLATGKAISAEAEGLKASIAEEDKTNPLDTKAERAKVTDYVNSHLDADEQAKFESGKGSKTAMGKYVSQVNEAVANYDGTRAGKLQLRQQLDNIYQAQRGKMAFQSDSGNLLDETHTDIRDEINKDLKSSTQNTATQVSLDKQTKLYRAKDVLDSKARAEGASQLEQIIKEHPTLTLMGRRIGMREIMEGLSAAGLSVYGLKKLFNK